jgi:LemA protein
MKRLFLNLLVALSVAASLSSCGYNSGVEKQEKVDAQWGQVQNVYQLRADKVKSLVATVKGAANFEKSTLEAVVNARAKATSVNISPDKLDEASLAKFQAAQQGLSSALGRLMVVVEKYPDLKSNQNFLELQAEIVSIENKIGVERMRFNEAVQDFNTHIKTFPNNMFAGMFGFEKKGYFKADETSQKAPDIQF